MILHEKSDRLVPVAAPVLLQIPVRRADIAEEPLHLLLVVEDAAVEMARVPAQQDIADIEHDGGRLTHNRRTFFFIRRKDLSG